MERDIQAIKQEFKAVHEYIGILKRYKYQMLAVSITGLLLSIIIAMQLPHVYKSTATILIDQSGMPENIVKSMVTNYAEQRIQIINQKIMSSENLKNIMDKFNLYAEERQKRSIHSVTNKMRENTSMEMLGGDPMIDPRSGKLIKPTIGFTLSFDSKSPEIAQKVASELVSLYLNANINQRARAVEGATSFLQQETTRLRDEIAILEKKIAKFKEANAASLPGLSQINLSRIDRIEQQLSEANSNIRLLTDRELQLRTQLSQLDPNTTAYSSTGQRIYGIDDRLAILQAEYAALSSKYSEGHPDLVKMRREISSLQKESGGNSGSSDEYQVQLNDKKENLALLMERYSADHPDVKKLTSEVANLQKFISRSVTTQNKRTRSQPNNPAYIQLQSQLMGTQAELNSLKISRRDLERKLSSYEVRATKAPEVEREYKSLMRDYENATTKYREVKAKQMEATMAESMEKNTRGNEFLLLEPPLVPDNPFKPNRKAIMFLGLLASIAIAFGFVVVKESLNPSIYTAGRLASVIGIQPLVIIPFMESEKALLKRQKVTKIIFSIIVVLLIFTILWNVMLVDE